MKRLLALVLLLAAVGAVSLALWLRADAPIHQGELLPPPSASLPQPGPEPEPSDPPQSPAQSEPPPASEPEPPQSSGAPSPADPAAEGDWQLVLVSKAYPIAQELPITLEEVQGYRVDARIAPALGQMLAAARADGYQLAIISGYRTMERSRILYENKTQQYQGQGYTREQALAEAAKWVAPPGTSEHHTGLAVDIVNAGYYNKYNDLVEAFEQEPEAVWLRENAPRFGFILRFPKDKEEVTGIHYEPWHFRYVGDHAQAITDAGLTLEEYLGKS